MIRMFPWLPFAFAVIAGAVAVGCDDHSSVALAPSASALAPAKPASEASMKLAVDKGTSKVDFIMEAPQEKIRGHILGATEGDVNVDASDVTKTTGLIAMDLSGIELFQTKMDDKGNPMPEVKEPTQNLHVRSWLEIGEDAPPDMRAKNAHVEFAIKSIDAATPGKDVTKMSGADRKVMLTAKGDLLLHGRKSEKTVELEATFHYVGDKLASVRIATAKPFTVGLAEHDVRPREAFGKLAAKTLELLAPKVAKEALVSIDIVAVAPGMAPPSDATHMMPAMTAPASAPATGSAAAAVSAKAGSAAPKASK